MNDHAPRLAAVRAARARSVRIAIIALCASVIIPFAVYAIVTAPWRMP